MGSVDESVTGGKQLDHVLALKANGGLKLASGGGKNSLRKVVDSPPLFIASIPHFSASVTTP
jgi:hypothetical protein